MGLASYELYQMKTGPETDEWLFQRLTTLTAKGYFPTVLDYKLVFASALKPGIVPKALYGQLVDFARRTHKFRSVNTGDVLVLRMKTGISSYYLEGGDLIPFDGFFGAATEGNQPLTPETEHYVVPGQPDTWRVIDSRTVEGTWFFLMESEKQGANANWIVLDGKGQVVDGQNTTSFDEVTIQKLTRYVQDEHKPAPQQQKERPLQQGRRKLEVSEQYRENGEYLRAASSEVGEEQNYNMIDGTMNNSRKKRCRRRSVRARLQEKQQMLHGGQPEKNRVLEHP